MFGIAGILRFSSAPYPLSPVDAIARMARAMSHRGPDGEGFLAGVKRNNTGNSDRDAKSRIVQRTVDRII